MIIKSMSRKAPTFTQLYDYIVRDDDNDIRYNFTHNCFATNRADILDEFYANADHLKKRKGSNFLYHEILSVTRSKQLTEDEQKDLLRDITQQYIHARAKDCLVFAGLHDEKDNQLHYHLIISANKVGEKKRYYHSKQGFDVIKIRLEEYVLERYPELEQAKLISKSKTKDKNNQTTKSAHANKREGEYVRRTGKPSKKQQAADRLKAIFAASESIQHYTQQLQDENIQSYMRGKTMGFVVDGRKHRIHTLGIAEEFDEMLLNFESKQSKENPSQYKQAEAYREKLESTLKPTSKTQQTKQQTQAYTYDDMVAKRMAQMKAKYDDIKLAEKDKSQSQEASQSKGRSR